MPSTMFNASEMMMRAPDRPGGGGISTTPFLDSLRQYLNGRHPIAMVESLTKNPQPTQRNELIQLREKLAEWRDHDPGSQDDATQTILSGLIGKLERTINDLSEEKEEKGTETIKHYLLKRRGIRKVRKRLPEFY